MFPGKYNTQELHYWHHHASSTLSKWEYIKDRNDYWYYFYNALHKNPPTSEKIVSLYYHWTNTGDATDQIWAYIMQYNGL